MEAEQLTGSIAALREETSERLHAVHEGAEAQCGGRTGLEWQRTGQQDPWPEGKS